jgi:trimeric autotransporter adhesin
MTKARILADFISDGSSLADGTISVAEVSGAAPLASPTFTGTASGTFSGPLTGAVTGNVTGAVTGNVTGNLTGDVLGDLDLTAISATIADTAVDIFVYDTSKDSDGGAWRKRTQGTSWYNETLGTGTRGSRKEFPAVAVIVVHQLTSTGKVTIYDGDDPDMPMWMVLNGNAEATDLIPSFSTTSLSCVSALNGIVMVGNGTYDIDSVNFVEDAGYKWSNSSKSKYEGSIEQRADGLGFSGNYGSGIVNRAVNDVAMTVLPNAPIDAATGLPVPTIAVATNGGVSVIKDDGTVVDYVGTSQPDPVTGVEFVDKDKIIIVNRYQATLHNLVSSDDTGQYYSQISSYITRITNTSSHYDVSTPSVLGTSMPKNVVQTSDSTASFAEFGVGLANNWEDGGGNHLSAYITSDYNTGWMNGDIKLATLSDTDDTDVTGSELVTNGDFSSTLGAEWDLSTGSGTIAIVSGQLEITQGGSSSVMYASQDFTTVSGKTYTLSFKVVATTEANYFRVKVGTYANATNLGVTSTLTAAGEYSITFTATGSTSWVTLHSDQNANKKTTWDNVSVRLAEEDRSVNANGLQVFGTITKTAVATGADLVAYTGFSSSNFMVQPYNSDLDFGTGDFSIMGWINVGSSVSPYASILSRVLSANSETNAWSLRIDSSANNYYLYTNNASVFTSPVTRLTWQFLTVARRSGVVYFYVNGAFRTTGPMANTITNVGACVVVGYESTHNMGNSSVALWRISATAPSAEQIAKIYEDEKYLFQENAQATLYGSSDAVTALAYDDTTELLHVGTSQGRSVFQGLRRVDNTTSAVGAAISASNGLVAED